MHVLQRRLGEMEHGDDIGSERVLNLLHGDLSDARVGHFKSRVVHKDVKVPELQHRALVARAAVPFVADVAVHEERFAARRFHHALRLTRVLVLAQVGDQHVGTFAGERQRDGSTNAAVSARDEGGSSRQTAVALVGIFAKVGSGIHPGLRTWRLLRLNGKRRLRFTLSGVRGCGHGTDSSTLARALWVPLDARSI